MNLMTLLYLKSEHWVGSPACNRFSKLPPCAPAMTSWDTGRDLCHHHEVGRGHQGTLLSSVPEQ